MSLSSAKFGATLYATENPEKFAKWEPIIAAYNQELVDQCVAFDKAFWNKCLEVLPVQEKFDSEPLASLDYLPQLLTSEELAIVNEYDLKTLLDKQKTKELTATQVVSAFIKASIVSHFTTNSIMQFLIPEALSKAAELDKLPKGQLAGPFHGIPISSKEQMNYKGKVTTASYVQYLDNIAAESSVTVQILESLGAVIHSRTSQPQTIMHLDTWNNIIGRTRNPLNSKLSPGGSSGGGAADVASHSSVIGLSSDIGGSTRLPGAFANLYAIRPTTKRISLMNGLSGGKGQESIVAIQGPLARSIEELDYFMDNYLNKGSPCNYDPNLVPLPWRQTDKIEKKVLRIGVLYTDNLVTPAPAITRGIQETIAKLSAGLPEEELSFEFVDLAPYWYDEETMKTIYNTNVTLYTVDGNKVQLSMLKESGEPILPLTRHFLEFGGGEEHSVYENKMLNYHRDSLKVEMLEKFYKNLNLDFILSPTYVAPAELPANSFYWGYTSFWNLLDYPNVIFPTGVYQDVEKDKFPETQKFLQNVYEKKTWFDDNGSLRYKSEDYVNGPVALQLTGKRYCDEDVVACIKKFEKILKVGRR
ncbi:hypothetical protein QEN19_001048 [Hanseniaspora menglaensis]